MNVVISKNFARYNLLSSDKDWCMQLIVSDGEVTHCLSATWPEGDEPDESGPSSAVRERIIARCRGYWIDTGRKDREETHAWMLDHSLEIDIAWTRKELLAAQARAGEAHKAVTSLRCELEDMTEGRAS